MQEVNAQIINHQQKHFMRSSWKILPIPSTLQLWVFSVNSDIFCFCAKGFSAWAQSTYVFYFFPLVLLDKLFFAALPQVKPPLPLPQQRSVGWLMGEKWSLDWCSPGRIWFKSGWLIPLKKGYFQSSTRLRKRRDNEVSEKCSPAQKSMLPWQVTFFSFSPGYLVLQMLRCVQKYSLDIKWL